MHILRFFKKFVVNDQAIIINASNIILKLSKSFKIPGVNFNL